MRTRSFLMLVGATVVLVAAAGWLLTQGRGESGPAGRGERAFPGLAAQLGELAWMRVSHGAMNADFTAIRDGWVVVEKGNYPAAVGKVRRLLLGLADMTLVEPKTSRPDRYARLDVDDPGNGRSTLVAVQDRTGKPVAQLIVGKSRRDRLGAGSDGVYVRKPGEDRAWLANAALDLPAVLVGWLDRRILDVPASQIASVALTPPDGAVLVLRRDRPDETFALAETPPGARPKDAAALAAPAAALAKLDLDDVTPAAELPKSDGGVATAVFTTFDGLTLRLWLLLRGNADWIAVAASGSGAAARKAEALNAKLAPWGYAIPSERAKLLRTRVSDLVEPANGS